MPDFFTSDYYKALNFKMQTFSLLSMSFFGAAITTVLRKIMDGERLSLKNRLMRGVFILLSGARGGHLIFHLD